MLLLWCILIIFLHYGGVWTCPLGEEPVCGSNNKTFNNICDLAMARYFHLSLKLAHRGPCEKRPKRDTTNREEFLENYTLINKILKKRDTGKKGPCRVRNVDPNDFRRQQ